jgi:hypothetical protein
MGRRGPLAESAETPAPAVVELFTSQGCSSCPPAEAILGRLAARPGVIALSFHVDYWDSPTWRDPYAIPLAAARQANYVREFRLPSAYTPQVVIGGRSSVVGSSEPQILKALPGSPPGVPIGLYAEGDTVVIEVPEAAGADCDVNLAMYRSRASTAVGGGENSGRTLEEFDIVRKFTTLGSCTGAARRFSVPRSSFPTDADRVAVLLQRPDQGRIVAAASIALP